MDTRTPGAVWARCPNSDTIPEPVVPVMKIPRVNPYPCNTLGICHVTINEAKQPSTRT